MSPALLDSPAALFAERPRGRAAGGRRTTLEERLEGAWHALRGDGDAECPVCHAGMQLADGLGRCEGCGTTLS